MEGWHPQMNDLVMTGESGGSINDIDLDDRTGARLLFRYLSGEEWHEYRAILKIFAGTFFAEFTPEDIILSVTEDGVDPTVVPDRLESLRRWGNLTVSSSIGNPSSLDDYYRRRKRYLITRSGQEVYDLVEGVLAGADEIIDVQAGRLRDLNQALTKLGDYRTSGFDRVDSNDLTDAVRTVFDLHENFTTELTQFFAELNLLQSRYNLNADEVQFFASVLVSYVGDQLNEIERMVRPIARSLEQITPQIPDLLTALQPGLAERVEEAGLGKGVAVRRMSGTTESEWRHLAAWFLPTTGRASRLGQYTRQAVAAVRALTANVTRLSRAGLGAASRRADFVRLASFFNQAATKEEAHKIASAAFGLGSCRHLGRLSEDADDPAPTVTPWRDAPRAVVPVSLRERGDISPRGGTTPVRDRHKEHDLMRRRREQDRVVRRTSAAELLARADADGRIDGSRISVEAFAMLRDLIGRSRPGRSADPATRVSTEEGVRCEVRREAGAHTVVCCPDGQFEMYDLVVTVTTVDDVELAGASI